MNNMHSMKCPKCCYRFEFYMPEIRTTMYPPTQPPKPVVWLKKGGEFQGYYKCDQFGKQKSEDDFWATMEIWRAVVGDIAEIRVWEPPVDCSESIGIKLDGIRQAMLDVGKLNTEMSRLCRDVREGKRGAGEASLEKWDRLIEFAEGCESWDYFDGIQWRADCGLCAEYFDDDNCLRCPLFERFGECYKTSQWKGMEQSRESYNLHSWRVFARRFRCLIEACLRGEGKEEKKPEYEWIYGVYDKRESKSCYVAAHYGKEYKSLSGDSPESVLRELSARLHDEDNHCVCQGTPVFGVRKLTSREIEKYGNRDASDARRFAELGRWAAFYNGKYIKSTYSGMLAPEYNRPEGVVECVLNMLCPTTTVTLDDLKVIE